MNKRTDLMQMSAVSNHVTYQAPNVQFVWPRYP